MTAVSVIIKLSFVLLCVLLILILSLYLYFRDYFKYWGERNVPHDEPIFPFGSLKSAQNVNFGQFSKKMYDSKMKYHRYFGLWFSHRPCLFVNDPDLIKQILIKDFDSFHDRGMYYHKKMDPLSANITALEGEEWRAIRSKLSPAFTPNKVKMMLPLIAECALKMIDILRKPAETNQVVDMQDVTCRMATDVISCCCFGIKGDALRNPNAETTKMAKAFFETNTITLIKNLTALIAPDLAKKIKMRLIPKQVENFFMNYFRQLVEHRENNKITKNDAFQTLIDLKNKGFTPGETDQKDETTSNKKLSFPELAAEAFTLVSGGTESTSIVIQFTLYELSLNQTIQEKARAEIKQVLICHKGELTYEGITEMKYLKQIVDETLRKYPPTSGLLRSATKTYKIPDTDVVIEKGTPVAIATVGIQNDEKYYPNPEKFDPDRFADVKKASRHSCVYLPFGDGPRNCIGRNLALMEIRVALALLLQNFRFDLPNNGNTGKTGEFHPQAILLTPKNMDLKISLV